MILDENEKAPRLNEYATLFDVYIDRALQNDSVPGEDILEHAGDIYAMVGDMTRALEYWQKAAETAPDFNVVLRKKIKKKKYIK